MKRILLMSAAAMASAALSAQTVKTMSDLKPEQKSMAISLKLTGRLSAEPNGDYRQMRDLCFQVRTIDLGDAQSTEIPKNAFHSRHQLENIVLPKALKTIGTQAFFSGHDHVNDYCAVYKGVYLVYVQMGGYEIYHLDKFGLLEKQWIQGVTTLDIHNDGSFKLGKRFNRMYL